MKLVGPVEVVGTGLLGTSIALACRAAGLEVLLSDTQAEHVRTASGLGAGRARVAADRPQVVVVAVPPDALGPAIVAALAASDAVVTDVGSVKSAPLEFVLSHVAGAARRYVGGHPMAGSERSGPLAASAALFDGRPWAVVPHEESDPAAVELVTELAQICAAVPSVLSPEEHDRAVARTSHLPHLASVLVAGRMAEAPAGHLALSGQGVRDVTRIAGSDPSLWVQIVSANSAAVVQLLVELRGQLDDLIDAVASGERDGLRELLLRGNAGHRAIPGKHGGAAPEIGSVFVAIPDTPGELARLFAEVGDLGVNIEDVRIDHDPGRPAGQVELLVEASAVDELHGSLESKGWVVQR